MQAPDLMIRRTGALRKGLKGLSLCVLLMLAMPGWAIPLVLLSDGSAAYRQAGDALRRTYQHPIDLRTAEALAPLEQLNNPVAIAVGSRACEQLLQRNTETLSLICTFIPRNTFASIIRLYSDSSLVEQQRVSAIYQDQPLGRQLKLARLLLPEAKSVGTLFGPYSHAERDRFLITAAEEQLAPISLTLTESDNPIDKLQPVVQQSDVFLALPDRALFDGATAKWLLYMTLRQQIPVIGFSRTYVEAGALAAVYSTPQQIGRQTGELLRALDLTHPLPAPSFPRYFTVTTNPVVARTLQIETPDDVRLQRQLEAEAP